MTKPTFENRTNFKEYIRYFKNKFNSPLQKVPYFYIEDMLTYEEPGISTTTDVNVVIFDFDDTVNIEEPIENNELIYIPALPGDQINLSVDNSLYTFNFIDEDGGIQYDEVTYGLGDSIPIGDKNLTVKGLGGALLQPTNAPSYSVGISTTFFNEGQEVIFIITTENVADGTQLYYTISGDVSANDFTDNTLSGSFNIVGTGETTGIATITKTSLLDLVEEGDEEFVFQVRTGSTSGPIVATSSTITIFDVSPIFSITESTTSINEGQSVSFTISTENVASGTELFYTISGDVTSADFTDNTLSGSFTVLDFGSGIPTGTVTKISAVDLIQENAENFVLQVRTVSTSGTVVATSSTITINNTEPTFSVTPSVSTVDEGESVTFTVSTNLAPGTTLYYTLSGNVTPSDFVDNVVAGPITLVNISGQSVGTLTKAIRRDRTTEGDESFVLQLRLNSISGTIVSTSSSVTIKDTSRNVGENANGLTFGPVQVNRDNGNVNQASDWYSICNLDSLPEGSKIALFIDTSGSMTQSTIQASYDLLLSKLAEKNITIITVTNSNEDWITPFLTELN